MSFCAMICDLRDSVIAINHAMEKLLDFYSLSVCVFNSDQVHISQRFDSNFMTEFLIILNTKLQYQIDLIALNKTS